jgi:predicted AAA+ superfamily ATPase
MKRKIYDRLLEWKKNEAPKAALLIDGARRVGKSWIAEEFAKNEYRSYVLIDFAKAPKEVKSLFEKYQERLDVLFLRLSEYYGVRLHERETLFVFDEVQMCPKAREAIKHLVADGRYDYLETGSLVSIDENVRDIVIPSEEIRVKMFPMDFEEFLWAKGDETTTGFVKEHFDRLEPLGRLFHGRTMDSFREYAIVGGMPQAVAEFVGSADLGKVDAVKRRILKLYREDIRNHAGRYALKTELVFDSLAAQLSRHEKKFRLSALGGEARMREYEDAFMWLKEAMVVNAAFRSTEPNIGLNLNAEHATLKCYVADTGLLVSMAFNERQLLAEQIHKRLLFDDLELNKGMIVENVVAQMLAASDHELFFYSTTGDSRADRMEIDFLVPAASIGRNHNIRPLEVKSSRRYAHASLDRFVAKYGRYLTTPVVLHSKDVAQRNGVLHLPLYMAGFL